MPFQKIHGRAQFRGELTADEIEALALDRDLHTLQFCEAVSPKNWPRLESSLFSRRPDMALRVYGGSGDLGFLRDLPSLQKFLADSLQTATHLEALHDLPRLRELSIGIYDLKNFDFLEGVTSSLTALSLGDTRSKRPGLELVPRFTDLQQLGISHGRGLEKLAALSRLEHLAARSLASPNFEALSELPTLFSLEVTLGRATDLSSIRLLRNLKLLEICWVRGLEDVSFLATCTSLQSITLDRLARVIEIPDLTGLSKLRRLMVLQLKALARMASIARAPALESISLWSKSLRAADLAPLLEAPRLRRVVASLRSKEQREFERMAAARGIATAPLYEPFEVR